MNNLSRRFHSKKRSSQTGIKRLENKRNKSTNRKRNHKISRNSSSCSITKSRNLNETSDREKMKLREWRKKLIKWISCSKNIIHITTISVTQSMSCTLRRSSWTLRSNHSARAFQLRIIESRDSKMICINPFNTSKITRNLQSMSRS